MGLPSGQTLPTVNRPTVAVVVTEFGLSPVRFVVRKVRVALDKPLQGLRPLPVLFEFRGQP